MLQTKMALSSPVLRPYVWAYGMTTGEAGAVPLVIPLAARPKQLLTFTFGEAYRVRPLGWDRSHASPRVTVVGAQTHARADLLVCGHIDTFSIHFQPSGFHRLFGVPMTDLTNIAYEAQAVIGRDFPTLEQELNDTPAFTERIGIIEEGLVTLLRRNGLPDPVAAAANSLFARDGIYGVSAMASDCGLSKRQFERRFLAHVGVPPKLYARMIRFNAAVDHKLRWPGRGWSRIANDNDFYDQMHLVRDCRDFTGESPSRFLAKLSGVPEFHTFFAAANRIRNTNNSPVGCRVCTIYPSTSSLSSGQ